MTLTYFSYLDLAPPPAALVPTVSLKMMILGFALGPPKQKEQMKHQTRTNLEKTIPNGHSLMVQNMQLYHLTVLGLYCTIFLHAQES